MDVYITSGTYEFLAGLKKKKGQDSIVFMQNQEHALLYHETNKKTVFQAPRKYSLVISKGELDQKGFVAMNHELINKEEQPLFEERMKKILPLLDLTKGFMAYRLLRPQKSDTNLVITLWENEVSYRNWQKSIAYQDAFSKDAVDLNSKLFSPGSYVKTYFVIKEG
jgi:heme oxygenase (mycobilin-producing)